jgi:hypothetical protein
MSRMSRYGNAKHAQKLFARNVQDLETIAVPQFHLFRELFQSGAERPSPVKSKGGFFDFAGHEKRDPPRIRGFRFERGTNVSDDGPALHHRVAAELKKPW